VNLTFCPKVDDPSRSLVIVVLVARSNGRTLWMIVELVLER
jgi:hypothetical protein